MPISTSSFGDERDNQFSDGAIYETETLDFTGLSAAQAETFLKRLGGGVAEKHQSVEGIGWQAEIVENDDGVEITFHAHEELLDDLIRRFEEWVERAG